MKKYIFIDAGVSTIKILKDNKLTTFSNNDKISVLLKDNSIELKQKDFLPTILGTTIAGTGLLVPSLFTPLLVISGLGILSVDFYKKWKNAKIESAMSLKNLQESLWDYIEHIKNELILQKDNIVETILESLKDEIIKSYEEKKRLYESILAEKDQQIKDIQVVEYYKEKLKKIDLI